MAHLVLDGGLVMKPVNQTKFTKEDGNCMQACIASVLEIELDDIPNFTEGVNTDGKMWKRLAAWLSKRGYALLWLGNKGDWNFMIGEGDVIYGFGGVKSQKLEGLEHCVVVKAFVEGHWTKIGIVHDPRGDNEPYTCEDLIDTQWLIPISKKE